MEALYSIFRELLRKTDTSFVRYLYDSINWDARLIAITGARGTGKTTMILQHIKINTLEEQSLYVSVDNIYFSKNNLFQLASNFSNYGGKILFIDEVHKYPNWSQEIKNIYDSFPEMKIVFTGSSILDLFKGFGDLSRRLIHYNLSGMSFREYLNFEANYKIPASNLESIVNNKTDFNIDKPLFHFKNYLKKGYYPFYKEEDYEQRLSNTINSVLEVDIPKYLELKIATIDKLKLLMQIISESSPFKPNISKLAELLNISRSLLPDYFMYLERAGLINQLRNDTKGVRLLGKVQKIFLNNPNLLYVLSNDINIGTVRETFFMNQTNFLFENSLPNKGDFAFNKYIFEIGGANKNNKQIKNVENAYIVKDDIEYGFGNIIPLWHFGMLY